MTIASDLFRTVTVKINDISQQLPYIVVNQADDNGKIIRFVPMDHGQKVTGFTGARLYYPPRSDDQYGDYVTGVEADGAWDFTIPVGALSAGRVECNLAFIDGNGETYSRNVVFLVEPAVSGVFDPEDGQQTRLDKIIGTVQDTADTAIESVNKTASDASSHRRLHIPAAARAHHCVQSWRSQALIFRTVIPSGRLVLLLSSDGVMTE